MQSRLSQAVCALIFGSVSLVACSKSGLALNELGPPTMAATVTSAPLEPSANTLPASTLATSQPRSEPGMDHAHIPVKLPDSVPVPKLSIAVSRDWMSGLNLHVHTEHYHMQPPPSGLSMTELMAPSINAENGIAEGHAHLYINGEKVQRIYADYLHLPEHLFKPGLNQISVSINNHGHMYWTADGRQILATLFINFDAEDLVTHRFESSPARRNADGSLCTTQTTQQKG